MVSATDGSEKPDTQAGFRGVYFRTMRSLLLFNMDLFSSVGKLLPSSTGHALGGRDGFPRRRHWPDSGRPINVQFPRCLPAMRPGQELVAARPQEPMLVLAQS